MANTKSIKNAFELNHILASRNRRTGEMCYSLTVHKGRKIGSITITCEQFEQLQNQLDLKEETSLFPG